MHDGQDCQDSDRTSNHTRYDDDGDDDDDGVNMLKLLQIPDRIYFFIMMADAGKKWGWSMVVIMMLVDHRSFSR